MEVYLSRGVSLRLQHQLPHHPPSQLGVKVSQLGVALEGEADQGVAKPISMPSLPDQMLLFQMHWLQVLSQFATEMPQYYLTQVPRIHMFPRILPIFWICPVSP